MLPSDQINEIHRLHLIEKWSLRKIARHLHIGRDTLAKYVATPTPVIAPRLQTLGYTGGFTILKDYLHTLRKSAAARRAYVRMEPGPGERFDIDRGHFGVLLYNGTAPDGLSADQWSFLPAISFNCNSSRGTRTRTGGLQSQANRPSLEAQPVPRTTSLRVPMPTGHRVPGRFGFRFPCKPQWIEPGLDKSSGE